MRPQVERHLKALVKCCGAVSFSLGGDYDWSLFCWLANAVDVKSRGGRKVRQMAACRTLRPPRPALRPIASPTPPQPRPPRRPPPRRPRRAAGWRPAQRTLSVVCCRRFIRPRRRSRGLDNALVRLSLRREVKVQSKVRRTSTALYDCPASETTLRCRKTLTPPLQPPNNLPNQSTC